MNKRVSKSKIAAGIVMIVVFLIGFGAGYNYKAKEIRDAISNAFSATNDATKDESSQTAQESPEEDIKLIKYKAGEEMVYSAQKMKLVNAKSAQTISSQYGGPLVADKDTKFVIVTHTVTNTTDSPFTYQPFVLLDSENKQYNVITNAIGNIDNYLDVRELSPNVPETGVIVFKVPASTKQFSLGGLKAATNEFHGAEFSVN